MNRDWKNSFPSRRMIFLGGGAVVFGGLVVRLAELQLFRQAEFEAKARDVRIQLEPAPPHRGTIYDRSGRVLAGSKRNFYVTLRPEVAGTKPEEIASVIERVGRLLRLSDNKMRSLLQDATTPPAHRDILIADDLTWEEFAQVNVMAPELAGVSAEAVNYALTHCRPRSITPSAMSRKPTRRTSSRRSSSNWMRLARRWIPKLEKRAPRPFAVSIATPPCASASRASRPMASSS